MNDYRTELCTAGSGAYYVEVYALTSDQEELVHTTARRSDKDAALRLAREWIARAVASSQEPVAS